MAGLTRIGKNDRVIELGTGCGIIPLILAYRAETVQKIAAVEIQPELADLARKNVADNRMEEKIEIHRLDFRESGPFFEPESFDLVLSNPPYRKPGAGRINPDSQKALARHELTADVFDVFGAARRLVPTGGRVAVVYPATRLANLFRAAFERGFTPKRLTLIHSYPQGPGRLVHLECLKGGGEELRVEPPFTIYDGPNRYSHAMQQLYEERHQ